MATEKRKVKVSARSLANLRPHPEYLKRGGKKHKPLGLIEIEFCAKVASGVSPCQAGLELGKHHSQGYFWIRRSPLIRAQIDEFKEQFKKETGERVRKNIEMRTEFVDQVAITFLGKAKELDIAVAKTIHSSWQRTGAIKSASVSAVAGANAIAATDGTMAQIYRSKWLRDKESKMATQFETEYGNKTLSE